MAPSERSLKDRTHPCLNMVNGQLRPNGIEDKRLIRAFESTLMQDFVPPVIQSLVYADAHLPLPSESSSKRWLLAPLTLGKLLQLAHIQPTDKVLIIGCGVGYSLALAAQLATFVFGVECDENLANMAHTHMAEQEISHVQVITGALSVGYPKEAPYDVILIEGAVSQVPPILTQQLNPQGGRLVTIIKEQIGKGQVEFGRGVLIRRSEAVLSQENKFDASCPHLPEFEPKVAFHL